MKIVETAQGRAARECFESEWRRRYGITPPPALWPEQPENLLWRDASDIMDGCWANAEANAREAELVRLAATAPRWYAGPGGIVCPNNHYVPLGAVYCPTGGEGPVPANIQWEAEQQAILLGARVSANLLRTFGG